VGLESKALALDQFPMKKHIIILTLILFQSSLRADIVTDGTLGPHQNLSGPDYLIGADLGQQQGPNLFHSFQSFNLNLGETAIFAGTDSIHNILARVTGGYQSEIDGTLFSAIPNVNLYFLNPYGIVFGPNARLDIPGSFHASTADYLRLGNNGYFSARYPNESILTVAPVEAFGFLDNNPASITIQNGVLEVSSEQNLSLIGGDLSIKDGALLAFSGQINLAAVASKGEIPIFQSNFTMEEEEFEQLGQIEISQKERFPFANIDVSGWEFTPKGAMPNLPGGQIFIRAGQLILDKGSIFADTFQGNGRGIDIEVDGNMQLKNGAKITAQAGIPKSQNFFDNIQGGNITITANQLLLAGITNSQEPMDGWSTISTDNFSAGKGSDIKIDTANLNINLGLIQAATEGTGDAGNIHIRATDITLHKNGFINAGTQNIYARAEEEFSGNAGNITLNTNYLIALLDNSSLSTAAAPTSKGNAGQITLNSAFLILENASEINSFSNGTGNSGKIEIKADTAALFTNRGNIVSEAIQGQGGNIAINSNHFFQTDSVLSASSQWGVDGEIQINAPEEHLDEELVALPKQYSDASHQLKKNCAERASNKDSFVVTSEIPKEVIKDLLKSPKPPVYDGFSEAKRLANYQTFQSQLNPPQPPFTKVGKEGIYFFQVKSNALGHLAGLYASERRYQEALQLNQQALDVLLSPEEQVYETYLQQASQLEAFKLIRHAHLRYRWQWQRARILKKNGQPEQAIAFYEKALSTLEAIRFELTKIYHNQPRSEIQAILRPLVEELVELRLQRADSLSKGPEKHQELNRILEIIEQLKAEQLRDYFKEDCIEPTQEIGDIDQNTAVIYPVFLPNRVELFVNLPTGEILNLTVAVTPAPLKAEIHQLRENLACQQESYQAHKQCRKSLAYQKPAHQLYQWLIRPLESLFLARQIKTLVFVPDGPLYTIPMAALYDGEQFLIEKYAMAVVPGLTLRQPQTAFQTDQIKILYTGLTQSYAKSPQPLIYAEAMGKAIEKIFATDILQAHHFVETKIAKALTEKLYAIVHIMSHAQFKDNWLKTYVNTYDNKLWLKNFETLLAPTKFRKQPIELLALGACQTAEGNERAALGLSGIAFKAGARSAIGTLWPVYDDASFYLFKAFYQQLNFKKMVSKAKLLQVAQNSLLQNYPDFRHPHYWSAFLLIGNW
jgi:filamentous hemagglutinin family protein